MRKISALFVLVSVFSISICRAQEPPAFEQLLEEAPELSVPVPPARGGAVNFAIGWDQDAPFSYAQRPAGVSGLGSDSVTLTDVRTGAAPREGKTYTWETVTIRPELLEKAVYAYKTFGTGHTLMVFTFREGGAVTAAGRNLPALTFGAEGWSREPDGYNITHALAGKYPLIWLVTSFESYADYVANVKGREIHFHNIAIGREQSVRLLGLMLARVQETNDRGEYYDLFSNSCTNNPVDLLNRVLPEEKRIRLEVAGLSSPRAAIPKMAVKKYLRTGALLPERFSVSPENYGAFDITKI